MTNLDKARFVYVTGHEFGEAAFSSMLSHPEYGNRFECVLLICLHPSKQAATVGFNDLGASARSMGVPIHYVNSIKDRSSIQAVETAQPDYLQIIGWSELAPSALLDIPSAKHDSSSRHAPHFGCIGMHPTLLPEGRGRAPIPWAIIRGLRRTGVTAFLLEEQPDAGDIVAQLEIEMNAEETATTLFHKVKQQHASLGTIVGTMMANRALCSTPQDNTRRSVWPKRTPADGQINFEATANDISRLIRALTIPYPGAFFVYRGEHIRVNKAAVHVRPDPVTPGTILELIDGKPLVACGENAILFLDFLPSQSRFFVGENLALFHRTTGGKS